jgi:predicted N-formylglutamate amidohydrolase
MPDASSSQSTSNLFDDSAADGSPFELVNADGNRDVLILCDHASAALPEKYETLGLPATELHRHIAYDIGCAEVSRALALRLNCPAILGRYSRLLIDLNRGPDDPTIVMKLSDGAVIPANADVDAFRDAGEFNHRISHYHQPYHDEVDRQIKTALDEGHVPAVFSIHSFTPSWRGRQREWEAGVLWDKDPRLALPLIDALSNKVGLTVGDNEPYGGYLRGDTLYRHCTTQGLPHVLLEIRQDLIDTAAGQAEWVDRLTDIIPVLIAAGNVQEISRYGSRTDRGIKRTDKDG